MNQAEKIFTNEANSSDKSTACALATDGLLIRRSLVRAQVGEPSKAQPNQQVAASGGAASAGQYSPKYSPPDGIGEYPVVRTTRLRSGAELGFPSDVPTVSPPKQRTGYCLFRRKNVRSADNWWVKIGLGTGESLRFSTKTTDRAEAEKIAQRMRDKILMARRERALLTATSKMPVAASWDEFIASKTGKDMIDKMFSNIKHRCYVRCVPLSVKREDVAMLVRSCGGICAVTGLPLLRDYGKRAAMQPSLDRINSSASYELGNMRIVALAVNISMNTWGEESFMRLALAIAAKRLESLSAPEPLTPSVMSDKDEMPDE